jgi:membrane-associated phospholipid phosphatase
LIIGTTCLILFIILTVSMALWMDQISRFDTWVGTGPQHLAANNDAVAKVFLRIGDVAGTKPMTIACIIAEIILLFRRHFRPLAYMFFTMSGVGITMVLFKKLIARPRPVWDDSVQTLSDLSYPSGHTLNAVAISFIIITLSTVLLKRGMPRWVPYALTVYVIIIGADRIILGVHNFTDVIGGALLGAALGTLVALATNVTASKTRWADDSAPAAEAPTAK